MKRILVTGGAGFIGSNFIRYWMGNYPNDEIFNLDALTYAGNLDNLTSILHLPNYHFIQGDICNATLVERIFAEKSIDTVVHFAAESHVDRSISGPSAFIRTNIHGTFTLLEAARKHWEGQYDDKCFLHVSTDEVYGSLSLTDAPFTEQSPHLPNSPYAASKASSDHLVRAYFHTYDLPVVTTNCSNNYGPNQFPEKLIPLTILNALEGVKVPVYGDGLNIRDWLHVEDHCAGIEAAINLGRKGEVYNIGGHNERQNIDIVTTICDQLDTIIPQQSPRRNLITLVQDRRGHDRRYAIDATKITTELGWKPKYNFDSGIRNTIDWYLNNLEYCNKIRGREYQEYYNQQYKYA